MSSWLSSCSCLTSAMKKPHELWLIDWFLLPQVDSKELEKSLTQRSFMTATDSVSKVLTSAQAVEGRNAFVKVISHCPHWHYCSSTTPIGLKGTVGTCAAVLVHGAVAASPLLWLQASRRWLILLQKTNVKLHLEWSHGWFGMVA